MPRVETRINGLGRGQIIVDGHDLSDITDGFTVTAEAGKQPVVRLEISILDHLDQTFTDARVELPDEFHAALVALGWTPPKEARHHVAAELRRLADTLRAVPRTSDDPTHEAGVDQGVGIARTRLRARAAELAQED